MKNILFRAMIHEVILQLFWFLLNMGELRNFGEYFPDYIEPK